jgi:hypothetical protein
MSFFPRRYLAVEYPGKMAKAGPQSAEAITCARFALSAANIEAFTCHGLDPTSTAGTAPETMNDVAQSQLDRDAQGGDWDGV